MIPDAAHPGQRRLSSAAFDNVEMSVDLSSIRQALGEAPDIAVAAYPGWGLAAITAGVARAKAQAVCRDPKPDNPAHGLVVGKKTQSTRKYFRDHAVWVVGFD
jgi:hypothetical protein